MSSLKQKAATAFQRVKADAVEFVDVRLQDNSYWAKVLSFLYNHSLETHMTISSFWFETLNHFSFSLTIYVSGWSRNWVWCKGPRSPGSS